MWHSVQYAISRLCDLMAPAKLYGPVLEGNTSMAIIQNFCESYTLYIHTLYIWNVSIKFSLPMSIAGRIGPNGGWLKFVTSLCETKRLPPHQL